MQITTSGYCDPETEKEQKSERVQEMETEKDQSTVNKPAAHTHLASSGCVTLTESLGM